MLNLLKRKIFIPLFDLLKQGITPEMLALSITAGLIIGIIPMVGVSTAICAILAVFLRMNIVAIQIANYIAYPLQLVLYIPFIKIGEWVLGFSSSGFTITEIIKIFDQGFLNAAKILWVANLQGLFAWIIISAPLSLMIYFITLNIFRRFTPADVIED